MSHIPKEFSEFLDRIVSFGQIKVVVALVGNIDNEPSHPTSVLGYEQH